MTYTHTAYIYMYRLLLLKQLSTFLQNPLFFNFPLPACGYAKIGILKYTFTPIVPLNLELTDV